MKKRRWTRPVRCIVARLLRIIILLLFMRTAAAPTTMTTREESARDFHWNDSEKGREKKKNTKRNWVLQVWNFWLYIRIPIGRSNRSALRYWNILLLFEWRWHARVVDVKKKWEKKGEKTTKNPRINAAVFVTCTRRARRLGLSSKIRLGSRMIICFS